MVPVVIRLSMDATAMRRQIDVTNYRGSENNFSVALDRYVCDRKKYFPMAQPDDVFHIGNGNK